jgi:hypothetical protein
MDGTDIDSMHEIDLACPSVTRVTGCRVDMTGGRACDI